MPCVDLGESFPTSIYLQNAASIQLRTNPVKFAWSPRTDPPGLSFALVRTKLQCSDGMAVRQILKAVRRKFHSDGEVNTSKENGCACQSLLRTAAELKYATVWPVLRAALDRSLLAVACVRFPCCANDAQCERFMETVRIRGSLSSQGLTRAGWRWSP